MRNNLKLLKNTINKDDDYDNHEFIKEEKGKNKLTILKIK